MMLLCIGSYLKSVLRYKFVILCIIRTLCICMSNDVRIRGYLSKPKGGPRGKQFGETVMQVITQRRTACSGVAGYCAASNCNVKCRDIRSSWGQYMCRLYRLAASGTDWTRSLQSCRLYRLYTGLVALTGHDPCNLVDCTGCIQGF